MSKSKKKVVRSEVEEKEEPVVPEEVIPPEPHFLTEDSLRLWKVWQKDESPRELVPPQTPNSEYDFSNTFHPFPETFRELDDLEIPYVRDKGVKFCIDTLGEYFGCKDYGFNLLQFWFLDVLTDCIWTAQDNFRLPVEQQKIVLAWVLYSIDLLRDPQKNMSRRKFFTVFKEAMLVAAEVIDEGCETVPTPEKLFSLVQEEEEPKSWTSSDSKSESSSIAVGEADFDNMSCVELEEGARRRRFVLPEETCNCAEYDLSSVDSVSESDLLGKRLEEEASKEEVLEKGKFVQEEETLGDIEFYQPDANIPPRFLPFSEEEEEEEEEESVEVEDELNRPLCKVENSEDRKQDANFENLINKNPQNNETEAKSEESAEDKCHVYEIPEKFCMKSTSEMSTSTKPFSETTGSIAAKSQTDNPNGDKTKSRWDSLKPHQKFADEVFPDSDLLEKYREKQILKDLAFHKLWEQRLKDMDNPRKGWIPTGNEVDATTEVKVEEEEQISEEDDASEDEEWADVVLGRQKEQVKNDEDKLVLNFGVLRAIIDFVFKYFYESFQFSLVKLAFQATPEIVSQKLNHEWKIPKKIKQDLQKPKVEKEKKKKEKPKKDKPVKGSKKDNKDKSKKDKSSRKSDRKRKKDSEKNGKKKDKKSKKEKPAKLTKEQKAELERQRREQARIEEELRKLEENERFMFPLTHAATDELFNNIFENWAKVDLTKKCKGSKDKGDKVKKGKKK